MIYDKVMDKREMTYKFICRSDEDENVNGLLGFFFALSIVFSVFSKGKTVHRHFN